MQMMTAAVILVKAERSVLCSFNRSDRQRTSHGQPRHIVQSSRQRADQGNNQSDNTKDDSAGAVIGEDVEGDGEGDEVAGHEEDDEKQLGSSEKLAAKAAHQDLSGISHTEHEGISQLELSHQVTGIGRDQADSHQDNQRSAVAN